MRRNDVIIDAGLAGTGLVQLHTYMAEPYLRSGQLVEVLPDYAAEGPPISVLFPSNRHLAPKVRVFIDFVADTLDGCGDAGKNSPELAAASATQR